MIVVAIIGILAAVALPAYQGLHRSRCACLKWCWLHRQCRTSISETIQSMSATATLSGVNAFGCDGANTTKMVASIVVNPATGAIVVKPHATNLGQATAFVAADVITLTPYQDAAGTAYALSAAAGGQGTQVFEWKCTAGGAAAKYAPGSCR
jgi:type IV pilus assembly protein PilA